MTGFASLAPLVVILVLAWRMRAVVRAFLDQGAVAPESAVLATSLKVRRGAIFRRLVRRQVIVATPGDRYYLDETRYREWRSARRRRALILLGTLAVLIAVAWLAGLFQ